MNTKFANYTNTSDLNTKFASYTNTSDFNTKFQNYTPPGTIIMSMNENQNLIYSNLYLLCRGTAYLASQYPDLYAAIKPLFDTQATMTYNISNTSARKFNIPDLQGAFLRGYGISDANSIANPHNIGALIGTSQSDNIGPHVHSNTWHTPGASGVFAYTSENQNSNVAFTSNTDINTQPAENLYPGETRPYNYSCLLYTSPSPRD